MEKKKNSGDKTILRIHQILGIATGIVVFLVSITGCLWVFKDEIQSFSSSHKHVEVESGAMIKASEVKAIAQKVFPGRGIHGAVFGKPNESIEVIFYEGGKTVFYQSVFLNPYSGEVLHVENHQSGFFAFLIDGHTRLWLPHWLGSHVVSISIFLFLVIIVSGLILWWPNNKKALKNSMKFNWSSRTKWKKKNYDLHKVVGFYISILAFVLASTGCVMAFNWFYFIVYIAAGGSKAPQFIIPENMSVAQKELIQNELPLDKVVPMLRDQYPSAESFELHYPSSDSTAIYVEVSNTSGLNYNADYIFLDQYTLESINTNSIYGMYKDTDFADKVIRMNYDIHVGSIGGIAGKIIAFMASLIMTLLPVTGLLIWINKKKKKWKNKVITN